MSAALTERQLDVLALIGEGLGDKEIARRLEMSPSRVGQHVRAIKDRYRTERRSDLIVAARELSLYDKTTGEPALVPRIPDSRQTVGGALPDQVSVSDAMPLRHSAPWNTDAYRVGPGAFDGPGGRVLIVAAIIVISLGLPALLILGIAVRWALTAAATPTP